MRWPIWSDCLKSRVLGSALGYPLLKSAADGEHRDFVVGFAQTVAEQSHQFRQNLAGEKAVVGQQLLKVLLARDK